jgi:hypothetical protein
VRESGELQSEVQFPAFARERFDPGSILLVVVLSLILCSDGDLLQQAISKLY